MASHLGLHIQNRYPPGGKELISCDVFWNLMDRWKVPADRALTLIGHDSETIDGIQRRNFALSVEQARIVSCLLEIDLTLAVASIHDRRHRRRKASDCHWEPAAGRDGPM